MAKRRDNDPAEWLPFARQVEELRIARGMTKTALCAEIGISTEGMRKWQRESSPSAKNVEAAAGALGVTPADLWPGWDKGARPDREQPPYAGTDELADIRAELARHRAALERAGLLEAAIEGIGEEAQAAAEARRRRRDAQ